MSQSTFLICESINHKIVYILKSYWQVMPIDQQPYSKSFDIGICTSIDVYHTIPTKDSIEYTVR